ncbi:hypothetical protein [Streptomyces sp. 142MFCol3.1]|uniref:hypothetical protein n=1 Tax=Streptomyces sp. 142MFCol3.1 TaxID=1172179 RepID=UPI0003F89F7D|nr:hypothetical protein [Streptomyces sp. 142MFCol3.1]
MSAPEPPAGDPAQAAGNGEPRYEPAPGVGRLALWMLVFVLAAVVVVAGGVYFG